MKKRFFGLIFVLIVVVMMFTGCESNDRKETVDDSWATSTWEETILFEDILVEEIIVEDIIFEDVMREARIEAQVH